MPQDGLQGRKDLDREATPLPRPIPESPVPPAADCAHKEQAPSDPNPHILHMAIIPPKRGLPSR